MFTVALDGIWSIKRNLPVGGMIPGQQSRNSSLPQAKYYSRHGGLRSKTPVPLTPAGALGDCSACEQVAHHEDPQPKDSFPALLLSGHILLTCFVHLGLTQFS